MGCELQLEDQKRIKMRFFVVVLLIPLVYGDCPTPPEAPECKGASLLCGGEPGPDGCPTPTWCLEVDPYAPCSSRVTCPVTCPTDSQWCGGQKDSDGCPVPDSCVPYGFDAKCPSHCPVHCGENEHACPGGRDDKGCEMPGICIPVDPNCPTICPITRGPNEFYCSVTDSKGCEVSGFCMTPEPTAICQNDCPINCPD